MWQMLIGPIADLVNTVLKRVLPAEKMSEEDRTKLEAQVTLELTKMDWQGTLGQLEINKEEAKHESMFVAGWRPACGWVGAVGLAYHFVLQPFIAFSVTVMKWEVPPLPVFDMDTLTTLLFGMLGLGGLRSFEKWSGSSKNR